MWDSWFISNDSSPILLEILLLLIHWWLRDIALLLRTNCGRDATGLLKQGNTLPKAWIGLVAAKDNQKAWLRRKDGPRHALSLFKRNESVGWFTDFVVLFVKPCQDDYIELYNPMWPSNLNVPPPKKKFCQELSQNSASTIPFTDQKHVRRLPFFYGFSWVVTSFGCCQHHRFAREHQPNHFCFPLRSPKQR